MFKLLIILFIILHFARNNIFKIVGHCYFLNILPQIAERYGNAHWYTVSFQFNQFPVIKTIACFDAHDQHQNMVSFQTILKFAM